MANNSATSDSSSENTSLTSRQQIKLNLAATLAEDVARAVAANRKNPGQSANIDHPINDNLYRQALNRAEWMIREEENQHNRPIAIYQLFTPRDTMTFVELAENLSKLNWKGLQERPPIQKLIERTWDALSPDALSQKLTAANSDYVQGLIKHKVSQITGLFRDSQQRLITADDEKKISQDLRTSIDNLSSLPSAISYPLSMDDSKSDLFKDYCLLKLPEDHFLRSEISRRAENMIRPYSFFLFACVLDNLGLLTDCNSKLYKPHKEVGSINLQSVRQDLSYCTQADPTNHTIFPEFNTIWIKEYPSEDTL